MSKVGRSDQHQFSPDESCAEKAVPPAGKPFPLSSVQEDFRPISKTWGLYLDEARDYAKEHAEVWQTGLESLLIFAGLFAGVIASFLLESRKELRLDDQQAILLDILSAIRNEPPPNHDDFRPSTQQLWINGLWMASFLITLISAVIGVLWRSWLVKFLLVSKNKDAQDACHRWALDLGADRFGVHKVVTLIPLMTQISFILFCMGLGIQAYEDNKTIGAVALSIVSLGTSIYFFVTFLPLFMPPDSCPFQTPITDIFLDIQASYLEGRRRKGKPETFPTNLWSPGRLSGTLKKILYEGLIKSRKAEHIDAAVAELSKQKLRPPILKYFVHSETPAICVRRLHETALDKSEDPSLRNKIISVHLQALSQFSAYHEEYGPIAELSDLLYKTVAYRGEPLARWDFFPESVQGLAFSVRIPILIANGLDLSERETHSQHWETVPRHVQSKHRLGFVTAASRGLLEGKKNLRTVSAFSFVHFLVQNSLNPDFTKGIEWDFGAHKHSFEVFVQVHSLSERVLVRLFSHISSSWKDGPRQFLDLPQNMRINWTSQNPSRILSCRNGEWKSLGRAGAPTTLLTTLLHPRSTIREQGINMVASLAKQGEIPGCSIVPFISLLVEMTIHNETDAGLRRTCLRSMKTIASTPFSTHLWPALYQQVHRALDNRLDKKIQLRALLVLEDLFALIGSHHFDQLGQGLIPKLFYAAFSGQHGDVRSVALGLLEKHLLATDSLPMRDFIRKSAIEQLEIAVASLKDLGTSHWENLGEAIKQSLALQFSNSSLGSLLDYPSARTTVQTFISSAVQQAVLPVSGLNALNALTTLSSSGNATLLNDVLASVREGIRGVLDTGVVDIQGVVSVLKVPQFRHIVRGALPALWNPVNRNTTIPLFYDLVRDDSLTQPIMSAISAESDNIARGCNVDSRVTLVQLLEHLSIYANFGAAAGLILDLALKDETRQVQDAALHALRNVSVALDLSHLLKQRAGEEKETNSWIRTLISLASTESVSQICFDLLRHLLDDGVAKDYDDLYKRLSVDDDWEVRHASILLLDGTRISKFGETEVCEQLLELALQDVHPDVRLQAIEILHQRAKRASIPEGTSIVKNVDPKLGASVEDPRWRQAWIKWIAELAPQVESGDRWVSQVVKASLKDGDADVRSCAVQSLFMFGEGLQGNLANHVRTLITRDAASILQEPSTQVMLAWTTALAQLAKKDASWKGGLQILISVALEDRDSDVRISAYDNLTRLAQESDLKDSVLASLWRAFKNALKHRYDSAVEFLKEDSSRGHGCQSLSIVLQPLLKFILTHEGHNQLVAEDAALEILGTGDITTHLPTVMSTLAANLTFITMQGQNFVRRMLSRIGRFDVPSKEKVELVDRVLLVLHHQDEPVRSAALEILVSLLGNDGTLSTVESTIPHLVNLALEDRVEGIRVTAVECLIHIIRADPMRAEQMIDALPHIMALLASKNEVRFTVIELLSLCARSPPVRRQIASWIMATMASLDPAEDPLGQGIMELMSDLFIEERFEKSELLMLLFGTALASRSTFEAQRNRLMTALFLNYADASESEENIPPELRDLFEFSLFGNHAKGYEVEAWLAMERHLHAT